MADDNPEKPYLEPPDYRIEHHKGVIYGQPSKGAGFILIVDNTSEDARIFKRNMRHSNGTSERWMVGELNGVRLYCTNTGAFVLSSKDIYSDKDLVDKLAAGEFSDYQQPG